MVGSKEAGEGLLFLVDELAEDLDLSEDVDFLAPDDFARFFTGVLAGVLPDLAGVFAEDFLAGAAF